MNANIALSLWDTARSHPDRTAVRDLATGESRSYAELRDRAGAVAAGLTQEGLAPGDRVALLLPNSCAYVEVFLGALAAGLVVVPLNTRLTSADFAHMLHDAGASAVVSEPGLLELLRGEPLSAGPLVVDVTGRSAGTLGLEELVASGRGREPQPHVVEDGSLASLMYTSGTTGAPKAVMLSHGAWSSVSDTCASLLDLTGTPSVMHPAPLTHGAGFLLLPTLRAGGSNVLVPAFDPRDTAERIAAGEVHGMFLVPSMIRMLLDVLPEGWRPAPEFRFVYYAGSPIDAPTFAEATRAFRGHLVQSFAQMEAPMFLTSLSADAHAAAVADASSTVGRSAGRVIEGRQVRIVDLDGADVAAGAVGEVWAQAPQMMSGYWNRPQETASTLADGWLHTGDMGYLDDAGHLYLVDRVKDMIVTGGSNVYAREVEEVLVRIPGVERAAVIGLPHRVWGEEVTAVVVSEPGADRDEEAVRAACRGQLAGYKVPKRVIWVDDLPANAYGKVLKRELRRSLQPADAGEGS